MKFLDKTEAIEYFYVGKLWGSKTNGQTYLKNQNLEKKFCLGPPDEKLRLARH